MSIRYRLYIAFGCVSLLAAVSALVALLQLNDIGQKQRSIIDDALPMAIQSQQLKIISLRFINRVSVLSTIDSKEKFAHHINRITDESEMLGLLLNQLEETKKQGEVVSRLKDLVNKMQGVIDEQSVLVVKRIDLVDQRKKIND